MANAPDADLLLARQLIREGRLDVATVQRLMAEVKAAQATGGPTLAQLLIQRGHLDEEDTRGYSSLAESGPGLPAAERLGDYFLLEPLGQGGMGAVYLAEHALTGARRAVKVLKGERLVGKLRFAREGLAQARVDDHPNVLRVHAADEDQGRQYLVMDLATGGDLRQRIEAGPLDPDQVRLWGIGLCRGLAHVHAQGVLHRDLKPSNVLFDEAGYPKLVDFGLAHVVGEDKLTKTGTLLGTPAYMAPEQARGQHSQLDARTDVYGMGAVLYEALTGQPPVESGPLPMVLAQVLQRPPTPPRELRPEVSVGLEAVVLKALAKAPADRFQSAEALAEALASPADVRRPGQAKWMAAGALLVVAAVGLGWAWSRGEPSEGGDPRAAALLEECREAWPGSRPLIEEAERVAGWKARRAELPGDHPELDRQLAAWEGSLALVEGDVLAARRFRRASGERGPGPWTLAGGLAAVTTSGDPQAGISALDSAVAAGVKRPELSRWRLHAALRVGLDGLKREKPWVAFKLLQGQDIADSPLTPLVAKHAHRTVKFQIERLLQLPRKRTHWRERRLLWHSLRLLLLVRPKSTLTRAELERLLQLATDPVRRIPGLAPLAARCAPDDREIHARVTRHLRLLDSLSNSAWRAAQYIPAARRAWELARGSELEPEQAVVYCETLRYAHTWEACQAQAELLLARRPPLEPGLRARAMLMRGLCHQTAKRYTAALADFDAAIRAAPELWLAHFHRGYLHSITTPPQRLEALASSGRFLTQADPQLSPRIAQRFPHAALVVWVTGKEARRYKARVAPLRTFLRHFDYPKYAGWWLRLAWCQYMARDRASAVRSLRRAEVLFPNAKPVADLAKRVTAARRAVQRKRKNGRQLLHDVLEVLEERRRGTLP